MYYIYFIIFRYGEKRKGSESAKELSGIALLSATLNQCKKPNQQLLIPITVFIGMEQAFIGADFTQVIFCSITPNIVIYVFITKLVHPGLRLVRARHPHHRLRDDLLWRRQRHLLDHLRLDYEVHWPLGDHCPGRCRTRIDCRCYVVLAAASRESVDLLRDRRSVGRRRCRVADAD